VPNAAMGTTPNSPPFHANVKPISFMVYLRELVWTVTIIGCFSSIRPTLYASYLDMFKESVFDWIAQLHFCYCPDGETTSYTMRGAILLIDPTRQDSLQDSFCRPLSQQRCSSDKLRHSVIAVPV
jgi:hypothetical protein